jgi:hypothetical protein
MSKYDNFDFGKRTQAQKAETQSKKAQDSKVSELVLNAIQAV